MTADCHQQAAEFLPVGSPAATRHLRAAYDLCTRIGDPRAAELAARLRERARG